MLESMGISVEFSHHEGGPGQNEIDLRYADALSTADNIMTFRTVIKEVALEQGVFASFMPKPFAEHPGSGMHTHMSLFEGDSNAFYEAGAPYQLSKVGRQFIAGLLRHGAEITAVTNQWVNSYKRLWGGGEAPAHLPGATTTAPRWSGCRCTSRARARARRVEVRSLDAACNPYLAFALMLLAPGSRASRRATSCPPRPRTTSGRLTDAERRAMGIEPLPTSLYEAISRDGGAASWSPTPWASTSSTSSCATSGPSGRTTAARSPRSSCERYLPRL